MISYSIRCLLYIITILISFLCFFSCSSLDKVSRKINRETRRDNKNIQLYATEKNDSSHITFIFFEKNHFECLMGPTHPINHYQKYYTGVYSEKNDTIWLNYYKDYMPQQMAKILIKDSSHEYLIYPFKDFEKKIYIKIITGKNKKRD